MQACAYGMWIDVDLSRRILSRKLSISALRSTLRREFMDFQNSNDRRQGYIGDETGGQGECSSEVEWRG